MNEKEASLSFSEFIESGDFNDINLTIYYMNFALTRTRVRLYQLIGGWYDNSGQLIAGWYTHRIVVAGEDLAEQRDLISRTVNAEVMPIENETFVDARLYYVFEHAKYGELFSFLAFGGGDTMFVNGVEVEHNGVFYEMVLPFLPEDAVETIERYLNAMRLRTQ
ncbi:MAG: hypothetical protein FWC66_08045 [Oscillospiraceae bacterium]|nr:hypothetical protein [Oscillospiraceae bacterium]